MRSACWTLGLAAAVGGGGGRAGKFCQRQVKVRGCDRVPIGGLTGPSYSQSTDYGPDLSPIRVLGFSLVFNSFSYAQKLTKKTY